MNTIRLLRADEIEVRVSSVSDKGVSLLLYKNSRVDMTILDETFGIYGWQRTHQILNGNYFCTVSVKDNTTGEWIVKQDAGTESFADPIKGAASDSFKRACTNIGIGRELYSAPFIWIPASKVNIQTVKDKKVVKDSFKVASIRYDDDKRQIISLTICNQRNEIIFEYGNVPYISKSKDNEANTTTKITPEQVKVLINELKRNGISVNGVLHKHNLKDLSDMDLNLYQRAMPSLIKPDGINVA